MLHHNNAPAHTAPLNHSYLAKYQTSLVPYPPYSPDLAPADFSLFLKLKTTLKGHHFQTKEIQENTIRDCMPSQKVHSRKHSNNVRNIENSVSPVEGTTLKGTVLKML
jgi:transposase